MGFRGGGQIDPPPSISWFSSAPAEIGLKWSHIFKIIIQTEIKMRIFIKITPGFFERKSCVPKFRPCLFAAKL